jgi:hypothetical protein
MLKLAFLFLTTGPIHHEAYWHEFFMGNQDRYSIYVHAKNPLSATSYFKAHELSHTEPTTWANTMRAQIALLKQALKDPLNEKFIFVSETTIPLQTFDKTYATLMGNPESFFYFVPNPHVHRNVNSFMLQDRNLHPIPEKRQYKNSQWVILNRDHAQLMVDDTEFIPIISSYLSDQEHYPSTFLINKGRIDEIIPQDMTYVEWHVKSPHLPYEFTDFNKPQELQLMATAISQGYLFARKIMPGANMNALHPLLTYYSDKSPGNRETKRTAQTHVKKGKRK